MQWAGVIGIRTARDLGRDADGFLALSRKAMSLDDIPDPLVDLHYMVDGLADPRQFRVVDLLDLAVFDGFLAVEDGHQLGACLVPGLVERIDAVAVLVPEFRLFPELLCHGQYLLPAIGRRLGHLGEPLDELDAGARRVQRQENNDRRFLVHVRKTGD